MTHSELIQRAATYLQSKGFPVVITDLSHGGSETPDAIGFTGRQSTLIECKATRSDFLADRKKVFRRNPERGMGNYRMFLTAPGVIRDASELPSQWGWLECGPKRICLHTAASYQDADRNAESSLLVSSFRRLGPLAPVGMSVKFYTFDSKQRATIGIESESQDYEI